MEFILLLFVLFLTYKLIDRQYVDVEPYILTYYLLDANANKVVDLIKNNIDSNICTFKITYLNLIEPLEISKLIQNISLVKNVNVCYDDNNHGITVNIFGCEEIKNELKN